MGKSSGGSSAPPNQPMPGGNVVPYGQTSPTINPQANYLTQDPADPATMETISAAIRDAEAKAASQAQQPQQDPRAQLAGLMGGGMRNQFNQLSGQELLMMKLMGKQPENFDANQARNDSLMRIFAGSMGGNLSRGGSS